MGYENWLCIWAKYMGHLRMTQKHDCLQIDPLYFLRLPIWICHAYAAFYAPQVKAFKHKYLS